MGNFSIPNQINPGDPLDANKAMANWNQIVNDLNAGTVGTSNLADASVTKAKLATDALNAFLQPVSGTHKFNVGTIAIPWPGSSILSSLVTVAHGLGSTPAFFCFFMLDQTGTGFCKAAGGTVGLTNITAQFETVGGFQPAAGNNGTACWLAIS